MWFDEMVLENILYQQIKLISRKVSYDKISKVGEHKNRVDYLEYINARL
jgi:hypothetical protein